MKFYDELMKTEAIKYLKNSKSIINADNILEYCLSQKLFMAIKDIDENGCKYNNLSLEDIPNIAPPLKDFFIEMDTSIIDRYIEFNTLKNLNEIHKKCGVYFKIHDEVSKFCNALKPMEYNKELGFTISNQEQLIKNDIKWIYECIVYLSNPLNKVFYPIVCLFAINKNGQFVFYKDENNGEEKYLHLIAIQNDFRYMITTNYDNLKQESVIDTYLSYCQSLFRVALLTISFMHCKNIVISEETIKRQERRARERQNITSKYHVLNIEPMKTILKYEGNSNVIGLKKALHICRGHFRTYEDKGLFGKYKGTFWIPQHAKGNLEEGEIIKDYNVKA